MVPAERHQARRIRWLRARLAELRDRLPTRQRLGEGIGQGATSTAAAIFAYLPTQALGLKEGFWAAITAIAVVQAQFDATRNIARDQFAGAAIGGVIGVGVVLTTGQHLASYAAAVMLSMVVTWLLNVGSAARLAGVTATIILLVPHVGSVERMMLSRVFEVGWGVTVALLVVWAFERLRPAQAPDRPGG